MNPHDRTPGAFLKPILLFVLLMGGLSLALADDDEHEGSDGQALTITKAQWKAEDRKLKIKGRNAGRRARVNLFSAATGTRRVRPGK